jgi:hypothetical protein
MRTLTRGGAGLSASVVTRIPAGHPEGFIEGFATLYSDFADLIVSSEGINHGNEDDPSRLLPTVADGVKGVRFVTAAVESMANGCSWVTL